MANDNPTLNRFMYSQRGAYAREYVMVRWGKVLATRLEGGVYVADVADSWGGVYKGVRHINNGGGGPGETCHRPFVASGGTEQTANSPDLDNLSEVLLLFPDTPRPHPIIIGAHNHLTTRGLLTGAETDPARGSINTGTALAADNDVDLHPKTQYRSAVDVLRGVRQIFGYTGFYGLDTTALNKPMKFHVGEDMFARFVHGLEATHGSSERVPLAYKFFDKIDEMLTLMENLRDAVLGIRSILDVAHKAATTAGSAINDPNPIIAAAGAVAWIKAFDAANLGKWTYQDILPYIDFNHAEHAAAIFRISTKTAAEGG